MPRWYKQHKELEVEVYERVEHAIASADVIVTATNAQTPVFDQMLEPGVHVNAVGSFKPDMQELPSQLIANADKVVVEAESLL